ncbi:MAG TPA: PAS domain S-box protein [Thermoanaerobaculia bacterium]|jgi:hypothetical protein
MTIPQWDLIRDEQRLDALRRYDVLDGPADPAYRDIITLATQICSAPAAAIVLVDAEKQYLLAEIGIGRREVPLDGSISVFALTEDDVLVIPDLGADPVYAARRDPRFRYYAGVPLQTPDGYRIGVLSVLDTVPRLLSHQQLAGLRVLSRQVMTQLELRRTLAAQEKAAAALRQSEERFRAAFNHAVIGMVLTDGAGCVIRANRAFEEIVGRSCEELVGRDSVDYTHPDDRSANSSYVRSVETEEVTHATYEKRYVRPDGEIVWARVHLSPIRDDSGTMTALVALVENITEQRRTREELLETRRKLDSALIAGEVATYEWDMVSDRLWGDPNFDNIFGVARDADGTAPLQRFIEAVHPDDRAHVQAKIAHTIETREDYEAEYRIITTPVERWVIARGRITTDERDGTERFHGMVLDITARKRLEQELERHTRVYESILSATDDFAYLFDRDGKFLFANRRLLEVWGRTLADVIGKNVYDLGYPEWHADMHMREIREVIEQKHAITGEVPYMAPTGIYGVYEYIFTPVFGADGEVEVIAGTTRDVTRRKQAEDAQRSLLEENERLLASERAARSDSERASRMKDEFLATLSHELRTPLSAILGWTQILSGSGNTEEEIAEGISVIQRNARVQAQIIEDLLEMSRVISGKIRLDVQEIEIGEVIGAAVATIRPAAEAKRVVIDTVLPRLPHPITGDANRLQQVFWNLLSNAVKFTPQDGRVEVRLEAHPSHVEIHVSDTGEGISPEFLPYVFDRFRQADPSTTRRHAGLGLGLAIVKQLVELHGGSVHASSAGPQQGSTFTVTLPLVAADQQPGSAEQMQDGQRPPVLPLVDGRRIAGLRILIVDDEADARDVARRVLEECGAEVATASSAREALTLLRERPFDVLVSDIGMPQEDGYSLIRKVREQWPELPAVALTAYARAEDREQTARSGYQMHLAKPAEAAQLIAAVAMVAGKG